MMAAESSTKQRVKKKLFKVVGILDNDSNLPTYVGRPDILNG